jgi:hypothetical protein
MTDQKHKSAQNEAAAARWKRRATVAKSETVQPRKSLMEIAKQCGWDDLPEHVETAYKSYSRARTVRIEE